MAQGEACPICGAREVSAFLTREQVPVHQNLLMETRESALGITRGDLTMAVCHECGFVFNRTFELSRLRYGGLYDNNQSYSPYFRQYRDDQVHHLIFEKNVRHCRIIDVGCGDGSFLGKLVEVKEADNRGYGFDPSYVGPLSNPDGRLQFRQSYYAPESADTPADVIVCRHVLEHVPDPLLLLRTMRQSLQHSAQARVFLETPCVAWILRHRVLWDFFYEHCSLFTADSLTTAFAAAGFTVQGVQHMFGGQYLHLEAAVAPGKKGVTGNPGAIPRLAGEFGRAEEELREKWRVRLQGLTATERVAVWGAGAKGVTFANLVDPAGELLDCVVDLNPGKQGKYLPGTGHLIVAPRELAGRGVMTAIVMNPNYREEIQRLLLDLELNVSLLS